VGFLGALVAVGAGALVGAGVAVTTTVFPSCTMTIGVGVLAGGVVATALAGAAGAGAAAGVESLPQATSAKAATILKSPIVRIFNLIVPSLIQSLFYIIYSVFDINILKARLRSYSINTIPCQH
jgi:hypothetical protein